MSVERADVQPNLHPITLRSPMHWPFGGFFLGIAALEAGVALTEKGIPAWAMVLLAGVCVGAVLVGFRLLAANVRLDPAHITHTFLLRRSFSVDAVKAVTTISVGIGAYAPALVRPDGTTFALTSLAWPSERQGGRLARQTRAIAEYYGIPIEDPPAPI